MPLVKEVKAQGQQGSRCHGVILYLHVAMGCGCLADCLQLCLLKSRTHILGRKPEEIRTRKQKWICGALCQTEVFRGKAFSKSWEKNILCVPVHVCDIYVKQNFNRTYPVTAELVNRSTERYHCLSIEGRWRASALYTTVHSVGRSGSRVTEGEGEER